MYTHIHMCHMKVEQERLWKRDWLAIIEFPPTETQCGPAVSNKTFSCMQGDVYACVFLLFLLNDKILCSPSLSTSPVSENQKGLQVLAQEKVGGGEGERRKVLQCARFIRYSSCTPMCINRTQQHV